MTYEGENCLVCKVLIISIRKTAAPVHLQHTCVLCFASKNCNFFRNISRLKVLVKSYTSKIGDHIHNFRILIILSRQTITLILDFNNANLSCVNIILDFNQTFVYFFQEKIQSCPTSAQCVVGLQAIHQRSLFT